MSAHPDAVPQDVLAALVAREPLFHRPESGTSRADFARRPLYHQGTLVQDAGA